MDKQQLLKSLNAAISHSHDCHGDSVLSKAVLQAIEQPTEMQEPQQSQQQDEKIRFEPLEDELVNAQKIVGMQISQQIQDQMKAYETNAYNSITLSSHDYLATLLQNIITSKHQTKIEGMTMEAITKQIQSSIQRKSDRVELALKRGSIIIEKQRAIKSKSQMEKLNQMDKQRLLKIKQGVIRSKLDFMNEKMEEIQQLEKSTRQLDISSIKEQVLSPSNYSLNSEKTKIAQQYIRHLSQQRRLQKKKQRERVQQITRIQEQKARSLNEKQLVKAVEIKQTRKQKQQARKVKRLNQLSINSAKGQKAKQALDPYLSSPRLFKRKQAEYQQKIVRPMQRYRQDKLKQLKEAKLANNIQSVRKHQEHYLKNREADLLKLEQKRSLENKMFKKSHQMQKQYFRGKSYEKMLKRDDQERRRAASEFELKKQLTEKKKAYEKIIRQQFIPEPNEEKQNEVKVRIEQLAIEQNKKLKKKYRQIKDSQGLGIALETYYEEKPVRDGRKMGNKYMEYAKSIALKESKQKGEGISSGREELELGKMKKKQVKKVKGEQKQPLQDQRQIWNMRGKKINEVIKSPEEFQSMKTNVERMDVDAANRQMLIKMGNMQIEQHIAQKGILDDYYLSSIKGKIKMLNL